MNTNNTPRALDCNLPPCPPGKEYGFTRAEIDAATHIMGLLTYIRGHGFPCRFQDGKIRAAFTYFVRVEDIKGTGRYCPKAFWQIDTIEPTLSAVCTWLGY